MSDSVYKIIELVGSSTVSWDDAARNAIIKASKSLRDLRIAEVLAQDIHLKDGKIEFYRTKLKLSFKYEA
jgi:flavin-binding protein dodecin